jgi:dienelactone hydrolase
MAAARSLPGLLLCLAFTARAEIASAPLEYIHEGVKLQGVVFWDDARTGKRPGVLVVHEWWGLNDYAKDRARQLAALGYVALAADMYGAGRTTDRQDEAGAWSGAVTGDVAVWRGRARAGLAALAARPDVAAGQLAAIGYCFGGSTVMQLAYSGADLKGVVSFHGSLPVGEPEAMRAVKARILVAHGAADPFVPAEQVQRFQAALAAAGLDWQFMSYSGAEHSFTAPGADARGMKGVKYDANADRRSWRLMQDFFGEIFGAHP